jgi:hypothetical protein
MFKHTFKNSPEKHLVEGDISRSEEGSDLEDIFLTSAL